MDVPFGERMRIMNLNVHDSAAHQDIASKACDIMYGNPDFRGGSAVKKVAAVEPSFEMDVADEFVQYYIENDSKNYYHLAVQICKLNPNFSVAFERYLAMQCTGMQEEGMVVEDNKRLKKMAYFFAKLLKAGCLTWSILAHFCLEKKDMSPTFTIFITTFFQEMNTWDNNMVYQKLVDPAVQQSIEAVYPERGIRDVKFFIRYFESLGGPGWIPHLLRSKFILEKLLGFLMRMVFY